MHGKWTLEVDWRHNTAVFTAAMDMETSDYAMTPANVDIPVTVPGGPTGSRGAHTHHLSMTAGVVSTDDNAWATSCQTSFSPAVTGGFVVTGAVAITGNGNMPPFGNSSPLTICVLGASKVEYSNITLTFAAPASGHFGTYPIHGVVVNCEGPWGFPSKACTVQE
jgi:hypothetical protein